MSQEGKVVDAWITKINRPEGRNNRRVPLAGLETGVEVFMWIQIQELNLDEDDYNDTTPVMRLNLGPEGADKK